ncbi:putative Pfs, NB-ARC and TPR domain protein (JCVI) [Aspergillus udagawae]|nr:putative Pfs, NB-ARC and TPR domain protein (JCVI) [Aspergillus udagawae]
MEQDSTFKHGGEPNPIDTTGLCLLSLDGGGVRGLSSLYILKSIMDRLNHVRKDDKLPPVKPCEVFDLIGGTSTGGLVAIMLGRLEMDVDKCIDAYSELAAVVFGEKLSSIPLNFKGDITPQFDSAKLESAIQKVIEDSGASKKDLFNDGTERGCRTFVCTADRHTKDVVRLRSYSLPHESNIRATICQAALATSAATTFFKPVNIGDRSFADGGLGANNPVDEVEGEASNIWCPDTGDLKPLVKCFISIGTGNPGKKPFEDGIMKFLGQTLVQIASDTENAATKFIAKWARHFDEKRYFRFNVEQGLQEIGLEEYKKKGTIEAATESYLRHLEQKFRVRDCIQNMRLKEIHRFAVPLDLTAVPVIENFVGRQEELDKLWQYLQPKSLRSRKVAILHGLGGIGKTQLAIRFARDHKDDFTAIFWLSGKDQDTLLRSLSSILPRLPGRSQNTEAVNEEEVEQRARYVLRWLALEGNSRWLIIFDNIDKYSAINGGPDDAYDLTEFFPAADHGSILITSRRPKLTELGNSFPVNKLDSGDAINLLLQSSHLSAKNATETSDMNPDSLALASRLDGLPLAIVIAGAFMRETGTSITEYLQHYEESWSELQQGSHPERQYQRGNMLETWMISYREIKDRDPDAAKLLLLLAHFDNRDIWYELLKSSRYSSSVPVWLERIISSKLTFRTGVKNLIGFSLLETKEGGGSYTIHPVVQDWCIHLSSTNKLVDSTQLNELALISVGYTVPHSSDRNYSGLQQRLIPHANYVHHRDLPGDKTDIAAWGALGWLGNLYSDQGKLEKAEEMYQRALAGYEKALGPEHTSTLDTVNNIGSLYQIQGKLKEAEEMYQRVLAGYEKALGPDHTSTLNTVDNLGSLYKDQGKLKEAEEMYQRALAGKEKALGPDHTFTLDTVNNLGLLYYNQGKLKEAEEMYHRALAGHEKALGPDHTSTLGTVNNLGLLYSSQGKLKEAEEMYQRALAGHEKAVGPDHTSTLLIVNNLGNLYCDQGKLTEAEETYQRALAGYEKALGSDHMSTLGTVNNIGSVYSDQGKLEDAEEMYQRALTGKEKVLGPAHTSTLKTVNNLGNLYSDQGKLKEAEEMYQRALAGCEKSLGPDHVSTLNTVNNIGNLYKYQGKLKQAEKMYQRALAGYEKALRPDHTSSLLIVNNLGLLYHKQGKLKEAEEMYKRALAGYEKALGPGHTSTLGTVNSLGLLYSSQGKLKEAEEMYQRALAS